MIKFDFSKEYILENDCVRLSPLELEHVDSLLEISNDREIWKYFFEKGDTIDNFTKYVQSTINNRKLSIEYPFVVFDKDKNEYAGCTRFYEYLADLNTIKLGHTWYGKKFRGTRLNKHCKYLLFEFAFEQLKVDRIGFGAYIDNKISVAAMESVGCQKEGILRGFFPALEGKGRTDAILLSILKHEWEETIKTKLKKN